LGGRLTLGVDETARTLAICDYGDISDDFGLGVVSDPTLYVIDADGGATPAYTSLNSTTLTGAGTMLAFSAKTFVWRLSEDLSAGNFISLSDQGDTTQELTDDNAEQAFLKLAPNIRQTATANYVGLMMDVTEASTGSGTNELMALRVGGADKFTISNAGVVTAGEWNGTAIASGYIGSHSSTHESGGSDIVETFPIGSVFLSVVSTNPNTLLGYGTWSAIAAGRMLVGLDSGDADFDTAEETGGSKTSGASVGNDWPLGTGANTAPGDYHTHSAMNPYFVVYIWKRTA